MDYEGLPFIFHVPHEEVNKTTNIEYYGVIAHKACSYSIQRLLFLTLIGAEQKIPENKDPAKVFIQVSIIRAMVNPV